MSFTVILAYLVGGIYFAQEALVCASIVVRVRSWSSLRRELASAVKVKVTHGDGDGGVLARRSVEQIGRRASDGRVVFADRSHQVDVYGGTVETLGERKTQIVPRHVMPQTNSGHEAELADMAARFERAALDASSHKTPDPVAVEATQGAGEAVHFEGSVSARPAVAELPAPLASSLPLFLDNGDLRVSLWIAPQRALAAAAPPEDLLEQARVRAQAARARGIVRSLSLEVRVGDELWVWRGPTQRMILSDRAPREVARLAIRRGLQVTLLIAALTLGSLVLALWPPLFGAWSTVGAVMALANFLLSLKWGKDVVEAMRDPSLLDVRGHWPAR